MACTLHDSRSSSPLSPSPCSEVESAEHNDLLCRRWDSVRVNSEQPLCERDE